MINPNTLKLGDELDLPVFPKVTNAKLSRGKVVYIHPDRHFFTLEFTTPLGKTIRESYSFFGPGGCKEGSTR